MGLPFDLRAAERHLADVDRDMSTLIDSFGPSSWDIRSEEGPFEALFRAIVFQQLSTASATAIFKRVQALFPEKKPDPQIVLTLEEDVLRATGVSRPKIAYMRDLATKTSEGKIPTRSEMLSMSDQEIMDLLCTVKGIGRWTVEMLLMFNLGRPDVLPSTDLVIRRGVKGIYGLEELPSTSELEALAEKWRPYRSLACWYIWRYEDGDNEAW